MTELPKMPPDTVLKSTTRHYKYNPATLWDWEPIGPRTSFYEFVEEIEFEDEEFERMGPFSSAQQAADEAWGYWDAYQKEQRK